MPDFKWTEVNGFFLPIEGELYQKYCIGKTVLEIGVLHGKSTCCASDVAKIVYAVDTFKACGDAQQQDDKLTTLESFLNYTKGRDNIVYIIGKSEDVVPKLEDDFFDTILIDAQHTYEAVKADVLAALPKLKDDGFFAFHDYPGWHGVKQAVDELFYGVLENVGDLAIVRKEYLQ